MVEVSLYRQIRGFAVAPEDIQVSDGDSLEVTLSRSGTITKVPISRKTVTVTLRGLTEEQAERLVKEADRNRLSLLGGAINAANLNLGSMIIEDVVLVKAVASSPIQIGSSSLVETTQLEFQSQTFN